MERQVLLFQDMFSCALSDNSLHFFLPSLSRTLISHVLYPWSDLLIFSHFFLLLFNPLLLSTCFLSAVFNLFFFWLCHMACGILAPQPGIKPATPALEVSTTGPPGKSPIFNLILNSCFCCHVFNFRRSFLLSVPFLKACLFWFHRHSISHLFEDINYSSFKAVHSMFSLSPLRFPSFRWFVLVFVSNIKGCLQLPFRTENE